MRRLKNHNAYTLIEAMMVVAILSFLVATTYGTFLMGQTIWNKTSHTIEMDEQLTKAAQRIYAELRLTGHDADGKYQLSFISQAGVNQSDIIKFSIPVICQTSGNPVDGNGDTAHWGAPLTWGCTQSSCMDQNNSCDTIEYKYLRYLIDEQFQFKRQVLDFSENVVREDIIAQNISNFHIEPNFNQSMVKVILTASKTIGRNQTVNQELTLNIRIKNAR